MPAAPTAPAESTLNVSTMPSFTELEKPDPAVAMNALDALFTESGGNPKAPEEPLGEPKEKVEPKAKEEPKTPKEIKPSIIEEDTKPPDEEPKPKPVVKENITTEKDEFDGIELPPNAKPKTGESFSQLKTLARERVAAVQKEREALAKQVEELTAKVSVGLPKEVEIELKTLREFRSKMDVEASPEFLTYDKSVAENLDSIYAKLKATPGIDEAQIEAVRKLGGPAEIDWDGPGITLPGPVRRYILSKLAENDTLAEKKTKAIADAKANSESFLASRREASTEQVKLQNSAVEKEIEAFLPRIPWLKELKAKEGASAGDIAAIAAHNAMVVDANAVIKDAITDNSPAMRAALAVGYAQLQKERLDFSSLKATAEATEKRLTAELAEATTLLAKIKKSSTTRLRDTPAEDDTGKSNKGVDLSTPGTDALDKHLAAIQAQKDA